jgi:hypothetical protein
MWTVVPDIYTAFTAPHIQSSIFIWTYMRCYCRYHDSSVRVNLQIWCQIQRISSSFRYVNCGPGHIQCIYSSAYSGLNIRLNVLALLLQIIGHFEARFTANLVPNTAHILPFALCELWSQPYTRYLQLRIFRLQYSDLSIGAAIVDITWILSALYCKLGANYSAHLPAFAMWTVVPDIYNVFTAPHIWASIFSCRYHRCYCRYRIISMRVILQT